MAKPSESVDLLLDAIRQYENERGIAPDWISGWTIGDEKITPPQFLIERISELAPRAEQYAYLNEMDHAKEYAAVSLRPFISIEGKSLLGQNIAIVPSSTQGLLLALTTFRDLLGIQRLVICAPGYFAFTSISEHLRIESIILPAEYFFTADIPFDCLKAETGRTGQAVLITNPAYGSGIERRIEDYQKLFSSVSPNTPILCDETSLGLSWDDRGPWSKIDIPNNVCLLRSPSKTFLLHGQKFSFIVASSPIVKHIESIADHLVGSIAGNTQDKAKLYLDAITEWQTEVDSGSDGPWRIWKRNIIKRLRSNLTAVGEILQEAGFRLSPINSGYYVLAGQSTDQFRCTDSIDILRLSGVVFIWSNGYGSPSPALKAFRTNLANHPAQTVGALKRSLPIVLRNYTVR